MVLIAKMAYVWLDQLSQALRPGRSARSTRSPTRSWTAWPRWGFTGLWLIGLWERSPASQQDQADQRQPRRRRLGLLALRLRIAADLGGEDALAQPAGARLAGAASAWPATWCPTTPASTPAGSSSTPTGSSSSTIPRIPAYRFTGGPISPSHPTIGALHRGRLLGPDATRRWSSSAATSSTGRTRYIYHGNDGTCTPWNDTAQLELPAARGARGGHPDHPPRGAAVSRSSASTRP